MEIPGGASLKDLLGRLAQVCGDGLDLLDPPTGGVRSFYRVLLGGRDYRCLQSRLGTTLADGDQVAVFPPVAGG